MSAHLHGDPRDYGQPARPHDVVVPRADKRSVQVRVDVDDVVTRHAPEAVARPHVPTLPVVAAPAQPDGQPRIVATEPLFLPGMSQ